ncbi:glutamate ABC transporter substrate-binding protein [Micromonospora sp. DR5-3]|uniref:glutamate ABC transporter substrate-binding protein n=1 Tax=unclassified Micromonospora TaxID=2617518 RepID=UPI0011D4FC37|nr:MULTISPECIES: glutamate ABC transporter substrate-binding protein [unclassified Micromonospora]MCW3813365.1 glutamate ABC transporter substrate-binding protein [Micromonospora sp. DR5-3]TYC24747.1 glutamate ABC transporter substrate-binding protein [Micromonospora sp. MP36]
MRYQRVAAVAMMASLALSAAACGKEGNPTPSGGGNASGGAAQSDNCTSSGVTFTPKTDAAVAGSPTFEKIKTAGKVTIGVKFDQPNLGYKDAQGKRCGFDVEIAQYVASKLGVDPAKIEYKEIASANRETAIKGGEIDYYVGTYSITDKRKNDVSFAGPYFVAGQDLLVRKDESSITGKDSLKGKKVCSATGSTPIQRVRDEGLTEASNIVEFKTYSECVSQLLDKKVDAVTTDDAILKGYAAQNPDELKVVGQPFSTEKYGIGLPKDDKAFRDYVNDQIEAAFTDGTWQKIYDGTLGKSGSSATPPQLERY